MDNSPFDRTLVGPDRETLREILFDIGAALRSARPAGFVPPAQRDFGPLLNRWQTDAEGYSAWSNQARTLTIGVAWWSDALGRKHCRIAEQRVPLRRYYSDFPCPENSQRPALALVYPERVFLRHRNGTHFLQVCCDCGISGTPETVGWMGSCCAACHDRAEEGLQAGKTTTGARTFQAEGAASAVAFAPKGQALAAAGRNAIRLWEVETGQSEDVPADLGNFRSFVAFAPRRGSLLFGNLGRRAPLRRRDPGTRRIHTLGEYDLRDISLSASGRDLALATPDQVEILDTRLWQPVRVIYGHVRAITCAALSPNGRTLATGSEDRTAVLWDLPRGQERTTLRGSWGTVERLAFAPDGKRLAVGVGPLNADSQGEEQGRVLLWDERTNQLTTLLNLPVPVWDLVFSPDGRFLLVLLATSPTGETSYAKRILVWDTATACERDALEWHTDSVLSAAFSPDGAWLATGGAEGLVKLWPWRQLL